jgi:hypothetical protein
MGVVETLEKKIENLEDTIEVLRKNNLELFRQRNKYMEQKTEKIDRILLTIIKNGYFEVIDRDVEIKEDLKEIVFNLTHQEITDIINMDENFDLHDLKIKVKLRRDEKK